MMTSFTLNELALIKETCLTYLPTTNSCAFSVTFLTFTFLFHSSEITFGDVSIPDSDIQLKV